MNIPQRHSVILFETSSSINVDATKCILCKQSQMPAQICLTVKIKGTTIGEKKKKDIFGPVLTEPSL